MINKIKKRKKVRRNVLFSCVTQDHFGNKGMIAKTYTFTNERIDAKALDFVSEDILKENPEVETACIFNWKILE